MIATTIAPATLRYSHKNKTCLPSLTPSQLQRAELNQPFRTAHLGYKAVGVRTEKGFAFLYLHEQDDKVYADIDAGVDATVITELQQHI